MGAIAAKSDSLSGGGVIARWSGMEKQGVNLRWSGALGEREQNTGREIVLKGGVTAAGQDYRMKCEGL